MLDLDRLRELAKVPERAAMPRTSQYPSMTSQLLRQKAEIEALRRGLNEAIIELERLYTRDADNRYEMLTRQQ